MRRLSPPLTHAAAMVLGVLAVIGLTTTLSIERVPAQPPPLTPCLDRCTTWADECTDRCDAERQACVEECADDRLCVRRCTERRRHCARGCDCALASCESTCAGGGPAEFHCP